MLLRCVNLDWLEVCCLEPTNSRDCLDNEYARNAAYFERQGYRVEVRAYGTPMYREMFTVYSGKRALIEVRRSAYSVRSTGGIFPDNICHLRLPNSMLYTKHPVEFLSSFIRLHRYSYCNTTRIDICLDFNKFDNGMEVPKFLRDYMAERYFKMNQKFVHPHGVDSWPFREYWSVKWGENSSPITTKLYEKSKELSESGNKKPYILDAWRDAGLCLELPVYRVEFSIKGSQLKQMVNRKTGVLMELNYYEFPTRDTMLFTFFALADRYFDFRRATYTRNGTWQRRDRCPRVNLFRYGKDEKGYSPIRFVEKPDPTRTEKMLVRRLFAIMEDDTHYTLSERETAHKTAAYIMRAANYRRKGIEMPNVKLELEKIAATPMMTKEQYSDFLQYMRQHWQRMENIKIKQLAEQYRPEDFDMPF